MPREILEHKKFIPSGFPFTMADSHRIRADRVLFFFLLKKKKAVKTHRLMYHSKILEGEKSIVSKILCNKSYSGDLVWLLYTAKRREANQNGMND